MKLNDVHGTEDDDYAAFDKFTSLINQLAAIVRAKDWDGDAKVRFLTKAIVGQLGG